MKCLLTPSTVAPVTEKPKNEKKQKMLQHNQKINFKKRRSFFCLDNTRRTDRQETYGQKPTTPHHTTHRVTSRHTAWTGAGDGNDERHRSLDVGAYSVNNLCVALL